MRYSFLILLLIVCSSFIVNVNNVFGIDRVAGMVDSDDEDTLNNVTSLSDGIPPGYILIEGDIIVPEDFFTSKAAYQTNLWTNNEVPYEFDANVTAANRILMQTAMQEWENVSSIDFIQCTNNQCLPPQGQPFINCLHIQDSTRNSSRVGMTGGTQVVNIFNWNSRFIIVHELGHALGYWHEHQRADRNQYLQIHQGNIDSARCDTDCFTTNFDPGTPNNYGLFDFDSVMHYGECAFAITPCPCVFPANCQTIEVLMDCDTITNTCTNAASAGRYCTNDADCDPRFGTCNTTINICIKGTIGQTCVNDWDCEIDIGQRDHLSKFDSLTMSFLYAESDWRFIDQSSTPDPWSELGLFLNPFQTFEEGVNNVPSGGTIIIQPGSYNNTGIYTKAMTLRAPLGGGVIGN